MDADEVIARATDLLRNEGVPFAYLHGSVADGSARETSDVDIAAFLGPARSREGAIVLALPGGVDLLVLDDAGVEVAGRIAAHGKLILELDAPARVTWEATTRKIWFDERPRYTRAHEEFIEAVKSRGRS